jgi:hypothetical protein
MQLRFDLPFRSLTHASLLFLPAEAAPARAFVAKLGFLHADGEEAEDGNLVGAAWSESLDSYYQYSPEFQGGVPVQGSTFEVPASVTTVQLDVLPWGTERREASDCLRSVVLHQNVPDASPMPQSTIVIRGDL